MHILTRPWAIAAAVCAMAATAAAQPAGYWPAEKTRPILEKTATTTLSPDRSRLTAGEQAAVAKLLEAGRLFQGLYERQRHKDAASSLAALVALDRRQGTPATRDMLTLYRLFQGPVATNLDNSRAPFLPVPANTPGGAVWPWGIEKAEVDAYLAAHRDEADQIMHPRTVVRRATPENLRADLAVLRAHPTLDVLHPGLKTRLERFNRQRSAGGLYAVPYSVAYADALIPAHRLLNEAADAIQKDDAEFAIYLRNRARDLLSDDYESGDASWVTGRFKSLNAQIGSYETYDDELFGVKTFFGLSLLMSRPAETQALRSALGGLQAIEDSLPYDAKKRIREDIPVGAYDVIADFGQTRGGNTATILPNEALYARRYGRTILMRANIIQDPDIFAVASGNWRAAVADRHDNELTGEGNFQRTLWHEIGHYLGVDRTRDGRELGVALTDSADLLEEMKADLVSLYAARALRERGYYSDAQLRGVYASGINRVLQNNRPRRDQPYNTMQLMQWNWFLDRGVLAFDPATRTLSIDYARYHDAVAALLREVLAVQAAGDKAAADRFVERWTGWDENLHGAVAANIRAQAGSRFRLFKYSAIDG